MTHVGADGARADSQLTRTDAMYLRDTNSFLLRGDVLGKITDGDFDHRNRLCLPPFFSGLPGTIVRNPSLSAHKEYWK